jgi:hypothetical protein
MIDDGDMGGSSQRVRREATPVAASRLRYVRRLSFNALEQEQTEATEGDRHAATPEDRKSVFIIRVIRGIRGFCGQ